MRIAKTSPRLRRRRGGFTILEVLIALLVISIGFVAIVGLQTVAVVGVRRTAEIRTATVLANSFVARLQRDAMSWSTASAPPTLNTALAASGNWVLAPTPGESIDPPHSPLGLPNVTDSRLPDDAANFRAMNAQYCLHYRAATFSDSVARIQIAVTWPHTDAGIATMAGDCKKVTVDAANFRSIHVSTMVMQVPIDVRMSQSP